MLINSVDITAQQQLPECLSAAAAWVLEQQTISSDQRKLVNHDR